MDSLVTCRPPATAAARPSPSDDGWLVLHDPARGTRRMRLDAAGRPVVRVLADGQTLRFTHDLAGTLRRIESGDWFVGIEAPRRGATMAVSDPHGRTDLHLARGGLSRTIRRGAHTLSLELDSQGRPVKLRLPGSINALIYEWRDDGDASIRVAGGDTLLTLSAAGNGARRVSVGSETYWDERLQPGQVTLEAVVEGRLAGSVAMQLEHVSRIAERRWLDGEVETFARDDRGRLTEWRGRAGLRHWRYEGDHLVEDEAGRRELDEAGRVVRLHRHDIGTVFYGYDGNGRRVTRRDASGCTRYDYDPLGSLTRVSLPDGRVVTQGFDGFGRRVRADIRWGDRAGDRHEHRDEYGRLWAVTDAGGKPLHGFIWIGDRIAARFDGPVGAPIAEAYACDPFGTPLFVFSTGDTGWRAACRKPPPFGRIDDDAARPALAGHFGDPATGLIHFAAREYDPELGLFLTPDPWHGGADDPRRWGGADPVMLARLREWPAQGFHDYALCRFDPLGRADRDGHVSVCDVFLHLIRWALLPTWGFPLTSISLFLFEPLNLYMEVIGLIVWAFKAMCSDDKSHPWGYHTIVKMTGLLGSVRQFTFAFGLNGFLPRVISGGGPGGDRAVTVGNVIWINREELALLGRPEVIEVQDIAGRGTVQKLNDDPAKASVVALLAADSDGKQRIHASFWTRGFGNAVRDRAGTPPVPSFADVAAGGTAGGAAGGAGGAAPGTLVLRQPIPFALSVPDDADDKEKLEVREFTRAATDPSLGLEAALKVWFSLAVPADTSFAKDDWLQITAPSAPDPKPDAVFLRIRDVLPAEDHAALILTAELPARLQAGTLADDLRIDKVAPTSGAAASSGWTATGTTLTWTPAAGAAAGDTPDLAKDGLIQVVAATGAPAPVLTGLPAGTPETTSFAAIKALRVVLTLAPDAATAAVGTTIFRRAPDGSAFQGTIEHAGAAGAIKLTQPYPSLDSGDLLVVSRAAGDPAYVRLTADPANDVVTIEPSLPADFAPADGAAVTLQKTSDTGSDDKASVAAISGADATLSPPHGGLFAKDNLVRLDIGGTQVLRRVGALVRMEADIADPPTGSGALTVTPASLQSDRSRKGVTLAPPGRFLKWDGTGAAPATLGQWDTAILGIHFTGLLSTALALESAAFYARWPGNTRPASFHPDFHRSWTLATSGSDQYVVLETPLPIVLHKDYQGTMKSWWRVDMDDYAGERDLILDPLPSPLTLRGLEFAKSGAVRSDADGGRVLAREPELLVPEDPTTHDTHRRALIEHEIHHTVQCNFWGPLMGAMPLQGLIMTVTDIVAAAGNDIPDWLKQVDKDAHGNPPATADGRIDHNTELNPFEVVSIGGIMQLGWKYVLLAPFLADEDLRHEIFDLDFSDFNKVFNPLSRLITEQLPQVDPHADAGTRWLQYLGQVVARGLDLRSWTPFLGFVPFWLPDGARNFIEQGASRASGDLYSTILTANSRFNRIYSTRFGGSFTSSDADLHPGMGRIVRLLLFMHYRTERILLASAADVPGSPLTYRQLYSTHAPFALEATDATQPVLLDRRLFDVTPAPAAADLVTLEGPAPARTNAVFVRLAPGATATPTLRSLVPMPPQVNRSAGFYFFPASQGPVKITGYYDGAGDPKRDAGTHVLTLTAEDQVLLDEATVPWAMPAAAGAAPTTTVHRFQTEQPVLKVQHRKGLKAGDYQDKGNTGFVLDIADPALTSAARSDGNGWTLSVPTTDPPGAPVRVRVYRVIAKDDPEFDLAFDDVPTLAGIRSYLDGITGDVFAVVRDVLLTVDALPTLADQTRDWNQGYDLPVPIKLAQAARAIVVTPPAGVAAPPVARKGDGPDRGETWTIGPLARAPAADAAVRVRVTFGPTGKTVDRSFTLTFKAPPAPPSPSPAPSPAPAPSP